MHHIIDASLAYYMEPIIVIFIGADIFKEKLTKLQWVSVALAALGVFIPITYYGEFPFIALVIAGTFAIYGAIKKTVAISSMTSILLQTLVTAPVVMAFIIYMESQQLGAIGALQAGNIYCFP